MDEHVRETLFGLCNIFDVLSRKSIGIKQLKRLQGEIVMILCELKIYFPPPPRVPRHHGASARPCGG
jgi:hypothetical protein